MPQEYTAENPAAFPNAADNGWARGMTLRDWFASQALIGFLTVNAPTELEDPAPALARASYHMADAMLAERAKATGAA